MLWQRVPPVHLIKSESYANQAWGASARAQGSARTACGWDFDMPQNAARVNGNWRQVSCLNCKETHLYRKLKGDAPSWW